MAKTLDDAIDGLVAYWAIRPAGGTKAELLSLAAAQGFTEPLLTQWLDALIIACVRLGLIVTGTYAALAAMRSGVTIEIATERIRMVFRHLVTGRDLSPIQSLNVAQILDDLLAAQDARLANVDQGIAFVVANTSPGPVRDDTLEAAQRGRTFWQRLRDSTQSERDRLTALAAM